MRVRPKSFALKVAAAMHIGLFCLVTIALDGGILPQARADAFSVTQFSPWHGYGIPNGLWLTGDFFGTHRNGIVHVVNNTDYVNVWNSRGDGTFDVKPFRPWAGYAMPNGLWLTADLTGDGRTDIVHVVQGTDYVNVWRSKGDGTFDVKPFRPWAGYAMPNGVWLTADVNGDGKMDLVHVVQGADYVNVWRSKGDGTFDVKPFRPWTGYAMPNGVWLTADLNGDGKMDLVHVVQGADYVNVWTSKGDGTFDVKPFRPWAGYAMPNGVWLTGKFTGSRNTDLVHIVQGADYANVWRSKGDGTFEVKPFRPWPGYAMPNGIWLAGDFDRDGKTDLVHAVQGTDYVHIWRSRGDMTFNVTTFSPWNGYAIPNGVWLAEDWSGDGKIDIVHAVQGTDYVHPWRSTLPAPGEFSVEALEVTQSVQDMAHSVPLVKEQWCGPISTTTPRLCRGRYLER
jgi:sulfur carrier protein ThiS